MRGDHACVRAAAPLASRDVTASGVVRVRAQNPVTGAALAVKDLIKVRGRAWWWGWWGCP
jgi:hypothetical protein